MAALVWARQEQNEAMARLLQRASGMNAPERQSRTAEAGSKPLTSGEALMANLTESTERMSGPNARERPARRMKAARLLPNCRRSQGARGWRIFPKRKKVTYHFGVPCLGNKARIKIEDE